MICNLDELNPRDRFRARTVRQIVAVGWLSDNALVRAACMLAWSSSEPPAQTVEIVDCETTRRMRLAME